MHPWAEVNIPLINAPRFRLCLPRSTDWLFWLVNPTRETHRNEESAIECVCLHVSDEHSTFSKGLGVCYIYHGKIRVLSLELHAQCNPQFKLTDLIKKSKKRNNLKFLRNLFELKSLLIIALRFRLCLPRSTRSSGAISAEHHTHSTH